VEARLQCLPPGADLERRYYQAVLQADRPEIPSLVVSALNRDLEAARATGDPEEVVRVLVELAATADAVWRCFAVARELSDLGRHAEALTACDRAVELEPDNAIAWSNEGAALSDLGRPAEALAAYDRAIELEPNNAVAWSNKGYTLNQLGRPAEALAAYDRAIELQPDNADDWEARARAKVSVGRTDEAVEDLRQAIALNGGFAGAFESLAEALTLAGAWDEAEQVLADRFRLPRSGESSPRSQHLPNVLVAILRAATDRGVWAHRVARLVEIAAEANALPDLGDSLVRSLTKEAYAKASADALDTWAAVWREVAERHPDLSLATRLFSVGVRYVQTKDERVLLDLVQEERSILRDLFGLEDNTANG
jgi:tetratricopeptide (TPR) repeat protein